jgi:hypothetical protein
MPKELLPTKKTPLPDLKDRINQLLRRLPLLNSKADESLDQPTSPVKNHEPDSAFSLGGALLDVGSLPEEKLFKKDLVRNYHSPQFIFGVQVFVSLVFILFLLITFLNYRVGRKIDREVASIEEKTLKAQANTSDLKDLREVSDKIDLLREYNAEKVVTSERADLFLNNSPGFEFTSFGYTKDSVTFSGITDSPLTFSQLAQRYLDSGKVSEILLRSASLDKTEDVFELSMEVIFK